MTDPHEYVTHDQCSLRTSRARKAIWSAIGLLVTILLVVAGWFRVDAREQQTINTVVRIDNARQDQQISNLQRTADRVDQKLDRIAESLDRLNQRLPARRDWREEQK